MNLTSLCRGFLFSRGKKIGQVASFTWAVTDPYERTKMNRQQLGAALVITGSLGLYAIAQFALSDAQKARRLNSLLIQRNESLNIWLNNAVKHMTPDQIREMTGDALDDFMFAEIIKGN